MPQPKACQQEIAQIQVLMSLNQVSQVVARERYLRLMNKLAHMKSAPVADLAAMDLLMEELLAAKLAYCATHERDL